MEYELTDEAIQGVWKTMPQRSPEFTQTEGIVEGLIGHRLEKAVAFEQRKKLLEDIQKQIGLSPIMGAIVIPAHYWQSLLEAHGVKG